MRAPISVIIPTLNAEATLPACLGALGEGLSEGLLRELILADGGSTDATLRIAESAGAILVDGPVPRAERLRRAAARAEGEWLLFLRPYTRLDAGWTAAVLGALVTPGAYHFRLTYDRPGLAARIAGSLANWRARRGRPSRGDHALLIHRRVYDAAGGYPDTSADETHGLARALGPRLKPLEATVIVMDRKANRV